MVYFVMSFVPVCATKGHTIWWFQNGRTSLPFCLYRGTTVHWHSEKASIQSLFLPHTLAERETSDLSLLYYPDAQAPLGNEILYYEHHAMPLSGRLKTNGEIAAAPFPPLHWMWNLWSRGTPKDMMDTWCAWPDPASVTAGALISVSTMWAILTTKAGGRAQHVSNTAGFHWHHQRQEHNLKVSELI